MFPLSPPGPIVKGFCASWEEFLSYGVRREYKANQVLLHPGEKTEHLYFIQKGEVLISRLGALDEIIRINIIREKAMLGIISMMTLTSTLTTWVTLRPCVCYLFSTDCVRNELPGHLLICLLEQLASMSSNMINRFYPNCSKRNEARLARLLLHLVDACSPPDTPPSREIIIAPSVTQEIAGELISMHPVTLNKILAAFRAEGIIGKFTKTKLEILDIESLYRYAEGAMPPMKLRSSPRLKHEQV